MGFEPAPIVLFRSLADADVMSNPISTRHCEIIFDRLVEGETITSICKRRDTPSLRKVMIRLNPESPHYDADFAAMYAQARELQAQVLLDQCIDIANEADDTLLIRIKKTKRASPNRTDTVNEAKLKIDTRIRHAQLTQPKKYGTRINNAVQNPDGSKLDFLEQIANSGTSRTQDIVASRKKEKSE